MTLQEKASNKIQSMREDYIELLGMGRDAERVIRRSLIEFAAQELESGDYILKADVVKMITELQAEVITESQDYHVRIAKLSVLSILKNQIKK
jgi:hypothetical protein